MYIAPDGPLVVAREIGLGLDTLVRWRSESSFEPLLIPRHERRFTGFDDKIVAMYARGMTVRWCARSKAS